MKHKLKIFLALGLGLLLSGCLTSAGSGSLSESSDSISESSGNISDSSSDDKNENKTPERSDNAYENEASDYMVTYLRTNAGRVNQTSFMKGISDIASDNGIVDWEADPMTYRAIGKALSRSQISGNLYESYKKQFAGDDFGKMRDIQDGYFGAR